MSIHHQQIDERNHNILNYLGWIFVALAGLALLFLPSITV